MPWFDLPLDQLRDYRTDTAEPPELDRWWQLRLKEARAAARPPALTRYEADMYAPVEVYDTEFSGAGGDRIRAWYLRPAGADGHTPVVVKFIGYGGGRGLPAEHALLPALGYALFVMDTRGQGGRSSTGATGDYPGDPDAPYTEVPEFLACNVELIPAALDTLRYVDCALLARRITARCLLSVGLMDTICPPSTVFAAYNEITVGKDISVHPFTGHAVPAIQVERQLRHLRDFLC